MITLRPGKHRLRGRGFAAVIAVSRDSFRDAALIPDHPGSSISFHIRGPPKLLLQRQKLTPRGGPVKSAERLRQRRPQPVGDVVTDPGEVINQLPGGGGQRPLIDP